MSAPTSAPAARDAQAFIEEVVASHGPRETVRILRAHAERSDAWVAASLVVADRRLTSHTIHAFGLAFLARRLATALHHIANAFSLAGQVACMTGHHLGGLRRLETAYRKYVECGDRRAASLVQMRSMHSLSRLGAYDMARKLGVEALQCFQELGDDVLAGQTRNALGGLCYRADKYREALAHYREARRRLEGCAAPSHMATLDFNLGNCLAALHRVRAAHRHFDRARATFQELDEPRSVATVECNAAYASLIQGEFAAALARFEAALAIARGVRDVHALVTIFMDRAELFLQMGMPGEARESAAEGAALIPPNQLFKEKAQASLFRAIAALLQDRLDESESALCVAREAFLEEDNEVYGARCDLLRAMVAAKRGDRRYARRLAGVAQRALRLRGRVARAASAGFFLAGLDLQEGSPEQALKRLELASAGIREALTPWSMVELLRYRGLALLALGRAAEGVSALGRAIDVLERHRGRVPADEFMVSFLASKASLYAEMVTALVAMGDGPGAFEYTERSRSRALIDMLWAKGEMRRVGTESTAQAERLRHLRAELNETYKQLHGLALDEAVPDPERVDALREKAKKLESGLASRLRAARATDPETASLRSVSAPALADVQQLLDEQTTLIEYFMTESAVFAFVVRHDRLVVHTLPVTREQIERRVRKFRFHMSAVALPAAEDREAIERSTLKARANLAALREAVMDPVAADVGSTRVVVVPHGALHNVPFHAFPEGDGWLSDRLDICYAPSAGVYAYCAAKPARAAGPACVVSLPDRLAPAIEAEREAVLAVLGDEVRSHDRDEATWEHLRQAATECRILHIASHGMFRKQAPMMSSIRLADRWMNLHDIYELDVRAELVVLSACETGAAHISAGDELVGLIRGFLYAGAQRLLLGQWRLHDQATAVFMHSFYVGIRERRDYLAALRGAMSAVRERYPHPYFWAPFFLVGYPG